MTFKPSKADCDAIRRAVGIECRMNPRGLTIEAGTRFNTDPQSPYAGGWGELNIALISDDPDWNDTDLSDHRSWGEFKKGFELAADGRAIVDFYIYSRGHDGELESNVTAYWKGGVLTRIDGTEFRNIPVAPSTIC